MKMEGFWSILEAVRAWVVYKGFEVVVGGKIGGILEFSL